MSKIAFVDICGTLFKSNTTSDFLSSGKKSSLLYRILNKASRTIFNYDYLRIKGVASLSGRKRAELLDASTKFYNEFLASRPIDETHKLISDLRAKGFKIIFISATLDFIAEIIHEKLGADLYFATSLNYDGDSCTGKIGNDLLGKKHLLAKEFLANEPEPVSDIVVITDDKTDWELASMAQQVFIVSYDNDDSFWKKKLGSGYQFIIKRK